MTVSVSRRVRTGIAAALLVVLLLVGGMILRFVQNTQTTVIPAGMPSGELVFAADGDGTWDVILLDAAGKITNLTTGSPGNDYFSSWDFKAERLNFISDRTGELGPTQIEPDGSGLRNLSVFDAVTTLFFEGRLDWDPSWSPDGKQLLWSSLRDLNLELYSSANTPGAPVTRLTNTPARDWFGAWSPDGSRIVFTSDRGGSEDLYIMQADGSNLRQITTDPAVDTQPMWSLDGTMLLFVSERENLLSTGIVDLYLVAPDGDEATVRKLGVDELFEGDPLWSADGQSVVYVSNQGGRWSLYQRDAAGGNVRRLTDGTYNALFPAWRPRTGG
ncbi:MAG: PD40 domain-containing protein [Anaerolineae bacterium]|nr:PD40 domain-containing protein [Anaerolineae bacterium]